MENIYLEKTKKTPLIHINLKENKFLIKGPSFAENIVDIYNPVIEWIDHNIPNLDCEMTCELYFTVLNSASHKKIFQILIRLNSYLDAGKKINVQWFYDEDDEDIMEMGEDLTELINIPFELIPVKS